MSEKPHIEIIVADPDQNSLCALDELLTKSSFVVRKVTDGASLLDSIKAHKPDALILEVSLPKVDGMEVCRLLREQYDYFSLIIIFLTHWKEKFIEVAALEAGADDFIYKPFQNGVLLARLKTHLHKQKMALTSIAGTRRSDQLIVDAEKMIVKKGEEIIELPRKEFRLVQLLTNENGKVFTRKEILENIWGEKANVDPRVIDVYMRNIRKKIGTNYFKTIKGVGYKFQDGVSTR